MKFRLPKIKKTATAFLLTEEGRISKESLIKGGIILGSATAAHIISLSPTFAAHANNLGINDDGSQVTASHSHNTSTGTGTATGTGTGTYY